jgi:hypothetical protein
MITLPNHLNVFFSTTGLTMSEANHVANIAKELAIGIQAQIENTSEVKETVDYSGKEIELTSSKKIDNLQELCMKEGEIYGLAAWLREGIKAKEIANKYLADLDVSKFLSNDEAKIFNEKPEQPEYPEKPKYPDYPDVPDYPVMPELFSEISIIGEFNIKERAEYYILEAKAAHLGKKIHNDGKITTMRKELHNFKAFRVQNFNWGQGTRDYPVKREQLYTIQEIDDLFFFLQKEHREVEKRLNYYKARIKNDINLKNQKLLADYNIKYSKVRREIELIDTKYNQDITAIDTKYNQAVELLNIKFNQEHKVWQAKASEMTILAEERRLHDINTLANLKIAIPNELQNVLDFVQIFSKKEKKGE